ncbi:MauE/DoxX family redox-associated membrane protein [Chitinophaga sp. 22620]|uniref:MauE/DoxX family redox-associated membrane protein n=1 Tax=Chitinophaga sp. 22620 TaxID=3453952 RepID=UPI003F868928
MTRKIALEGIVAILVVLWIYTGISKLGEQFNFMYQLRKQSLFVDYAVFLSYAVPVVELMTAILLVIRKTRIIGLWVSFFLMFSFTLYVALVLSFSKQLPCQCGGIIDTLNWEQHLILNIILTILIILGLLLAKRINRDNIKLQIS